MIDLQTIVTWCDGELRTAEVTDYPGAVNGLQVANSGKVRKIAAAVDGTLRTAQMAVADGASLLLVHHGFFWGQSHPWTGKRYELIKLLTEHDLAVYSSHLPLDVHPRYGNNSQLARAMGFKKLAPFFFEKGQHLGIRTELSISRKALVEQLAKAVGGAVRLVPGGPEKCRKIGIVTGGAGDSVKIAAAEGVDTFITGEGRHWTYALAEELGINLLYAGHYATETFGVKALGAELSRRFKLPWTFLDHPTGL
ncbi:MAG: Nif3-like dinuclear metal center hexameric protein [Verrucomicrobiota bacterium]|nr:Nif3-like dinuclear metal center hexameric protein [Verrucomicrobiota bacterium]